MPQPTWFHLRDAAAAGTRHYPEPGLAGPPGLSAPELLLAAGTLRRQERGAWQPARGTGTTPLPPPPETLPAVGELGEQVLETMLGGRSGYLHGYYHDLADRGLRVPQRLLAAVLADAAQQDPSPPYDYLPEVLGERGRWLARLHPAWRPLVEVAEERAWTHGTAEQRRRCLQIRRRQDPAQARAWLAASWPLDPPWLQPSLLGVLEEGLTADDGPLLRQALSSPHRDVRQAALGLLARLPENGVGEQVWEWARQYLDVTRAPATGPVLHVSLPAHWRPEWQAAGIEREHYHRSGEPAGWLGQMLALVPLQRWTEHWPLSPFQLLELAAAAAAGPDLLEGWSRATHDQRAADWDLAFLRGQLTRPAGAPWASGAFGGFDPEKAEALLLPFIPPDARLTDPPAPWQSCLWELRYRWTRPLLKRALQVLEDSVLDPATGPLSRASDLIRDLVLELAMVEEPDQFAAVEQTLQALCAVKGSHQERSGWALEFLQFKRQCWQSLEVATT